MDPSGSCSSLLSFKVSSLCLVGLCAGPDRSIVIRQFFQDECVAGELVTSLSIREDNNADLVGSPTRSWTL